MLESADDSCESDYCSRLLVLLDLFPPSSSSSRARKDDDRRFSAKSSLVCVADMSRQEETERRYLNRIKLVFVAFFFSIFSLSLSSISSVLSGCRLKIVFETRNSSFNQAKRKKKFVSLKLFEI